jgi:hypothetical protein
MRTALFVLMLTGLALDLTHAQSDPRLADRWVGTQDGRPLHLDFYGDTMLVVNDERALYYVATRDSLFATGDTTFAVAYWFSYDRLLLETEDRKVLTMSRQDPLARPLEGRWLGSATIGDDPIDLRMFRGGTAVWRSRPTQQWIDGEWDRVTRFIAFTWFPDSVQWKAQFDPAHNTLLFEETYEGSGPVFLRRVFRR